MVAGVDVRGGGPATHETDLLDPTASVERIHALVLTGGSAYGLAACTGVMLGLADRGIGLPVGAAAGRGGAARARARRCSTWAAAAVFRARPTADFGRARSQAALDPAGLPTTRQIGGSRWARSAPARARSPAI